EMANTIKLQSNDGEVFETEIVVSKCSGTIKTMLEDCRMEEDENAVVPLPNVHSSILRKVLEWAVHHKLDEPLEDGSSLSPEANSYELQWNYDFLEVDQNTLMELIRAANYLDIKALLKLSCTKVAHMIRGKTPEEIRSIFNIENDFTSAEEQQMRLENTWGVDN
ncbi:hypothetical protein KR018_005786, partial [Drosophila ironensis]